MDKKRKRVVLSLIECAVRAEGTEMPYDEFLEIVTQYGGRFDVTQDEVREVLGCRVRDVVL